MIGYWHHQVIGPSVRPSVCLTVCNAMHCGYHGWCTGLKVVPVCSSQESSSLSFQTLSLLLSGVSFSHNMHRKRRVEENANASFLETDTQACTGRVTFCYSLTSWTLVSHSWVWVYKLYLLNRIVLTSRSSTFFLMFSYYSLLSTLNSVHFFESWRFCPSFSCPASLAYPLSGASKADFYGRRPMSHGSDQRKVPLTSAKTTVFLCICM